MAFDPAQFALDQVVLQKWRARVVRTTDYTKQRTRSFRLTDPNCVVDGRFLCVDAVTVTAIIMMMVAALLTDGPL